MNEPNDLVKIVSNMITRDRQPTPNRIGATKTYNTSEIYDNPGKYMTVRGMFRYCGVDVI